MRKPEGKGASEPAWEREVAGSITARINFLQQHQSARIRQMVMGARLYGNASLMGVAGMSAAQIMSQNGLKERVTENVVQSVVDAIVAQVGENKPRPYFLTSGGTYKQQRKAKRLNKFSEGIFYENKAYEIGGDSQRDAEIFGDGFIHIFERFDRVRWERVLSAELWVDEAEGAYGQPREMHWVRPIDRECLAAWFPDKRDVILRAGPDQLQGFSPGATQADMVVVRESWHLPSGPDAKDGKHTISIDGHLLDPITGWEHSFFPFARFRSLSRPTGYWSQSTAERLQSKQLEINKLLWVIQRSMHMAGSYKVFVQDGSRIVKEHLNNEIGAVVTYRGQAPTWYVPQVVPMEYYSHYKDLKMACYEQEGVSLQSATGMKPSGLNSGEAQRVYRDTVQQRMKTRERNNERGYMDANEISVAVARDIAKRLGKYVVEVPKGRSLEEVSMTADDLDDSDWNSQCFPTSSLPKDPAGRLQTIQEYIQAGFMTPRQGRRALDFPDLEAVESLANAEEDLLTKILDAICDEGEFSTPEPTDDLQLCMELVVEYINRGRMQDLDEERIDMLRTWKSQVESLIQAAMPPAPPTPPPGMGPPQAAPMPPPTSQLIPNAPGGA